MSKELENLLADLDSCEEVKTKYGVCYAYSPDVVEELRQALLKAQEQEKVLEIIKKKTVSVFQLGCCKNVNEYNDLKFDIFEKLTQEEFDLLKRYLK